MNRLSQSDVDVFSRDDALTRYGSLRRLRRRDIDEVAWRLAREVAERRAQDRKPVARPALCGRCDGRGAVTTDGLLSPLIPCPDCQEQADG